MNIVAIIQARMGSIRLPGKMMMAIADRPIISYVVERVKKSKFIDDIMLATTTNFEDSILATWAEQNNILCARGNEYDVLDRYYQSAIQAHADVIVRITGDCPLIDTEVIDSVIHIYLNDNFDYVSNTLLPTYPDGLDVEVFSFLSLEKAWQLAQLKSEREHVTPYIWKHPSKFRLHNMAYTSDLSVERWTLDTPEDFILIRLILEECKKQKIIGTLHEVLTILDLHPEWRQLNNKFLRNEGYLKSVHDEM